MIIIVGLFIIVSCAYLYARLAAVEKKHEELRVTTMTFIDGITILSKGEQLALVALKEKEFFERMSIPRGGSE